MRNNEYLETMQQDMRRKTELDNSEWNGILQRKNSSYMDAVKEAKIPNKPGRIFSGV